MSTVSTKSLTEFYDENFDFSTITGLVKDNLVVENIDTTDDNKQVEGNQKVSFFLTFIKGLDNFKYIFYNC